MPADDPEKCLALFIKACGEAGEVIVVTEAMDTARDDFGLATKKDLLEFITNNGLQVPRPINRAPLKNNPDPNNPMLVDAYDFRSGKKFGYMAIYRGPTGKWILKSFKKNDKEDDRNLPFLALTKLPGGKK